MICNGLGLQLDFADVFHANMPHIILLVSKDESLLASRALLLNSAGFSTLVASTIDDALGSAFSCPLAIIDTTFSIEDHERFVGRAQRERPEFVVVCMRTTLVEPQVLIESVTDCLGATSYGPKVVIIDDPQTPPCQEGS